MKKLLSLLVYLCIPAIFQAQPISLHPDNPHYFMYKGKPIVIVSSSEHYGAVINPDFNMIRYLDALQKDGMKYTRLFTGTYFEREGSFGIQKNTLAPVAGKALLPWQRSNVTGAVCGGNKFDLDKWDVNYFTRLKTFIAEAGKRGIIVEFTLFSSIYDNWEIQVWNPKNNITIREDIGKDKIQTLDNGIALKYQEAVVRKIVRELNGYDNVIYEIQNEPWADHTASVEPNEEFSDQTDFRLDGQDWQKDIQLVDDSSLEWQKRIAFFISDEEKRLNNKHLVAQNYTNFYYAVPEVDSNVSILNFHYAYPRAVELNYHHGKVIGFDESGFSGNSDVTYRKQAWKFIIAGGGLFNNLDYSFTVGEEDGTAKNKAPGGGSPELRKHLRVLSDFMHSLDFTRMKPDKSTLVKISGSVGHALSEKGKQYAIYLHNGTKCDLMISLPQGNYTADWINTTNGKTIKTEGIKSKGGEISMTSPLFSDDIALKISRK